MKTNYEPTVRACFTAAMVQAVVNNYAPLLFLTFQSSWGIPLPKITMLVTINFALQLLTDLASATFVDRIGHRAAMVIAHVCATLGLVMMTVLPGLFADPFTGLLIAVLFYAVGGGLLEVLFSPIVEACPSEHKEKSMALLHSFYCWGHVTVVLVSTAFFAIFGTAHWRILALIWAVLPAMNALVFTRVPIPPMMPEGEKGISVRSLMKNKLFWLMMLMMICSGASEQAVSQWASTFAEKGLGVTKTIGDLAGPMFFAVMMGLSRLYYGRVGDRIDLKRFMTFSSILCVLSYLMISLSPWPALGLIGCGLCGLSVGIMWPGSFSISAAALRGGGTALFAFLALGGDLGCSVGPTVVGLVSGIFSDRLQAGILGAIIFPLAMLAALLIGRRQLKPAQK